VYPISALSEDSASQAIYKIVEGDPIIDSSLKSDAECQIRADSEIASKSQVTPTFEPVLVDGDNRLLPTYRVTFFSVSYIIKKVTHTISRNQWTTQLEVTNP
jgi:hypothetical protein